MIALKFWEQMSESGEYEHYRSFSKHKSFIPSRKSGLNALDMPAVYHYRLSLYFRKRRSKWTENK
ncbi:hypothetical protein EC590_07295 [Helicobacter pylori]|nr:hypothetical protein EC590_07295 [Helicobacter pylori]